MTAKTKTSDLASFFLPGKLSAPSGKKSFAEIYDAIRQDPGLAKITAHLQDKYKEELLHGFIDGKTAYQNDKKALLPAVTFVGTVDRSSGADNKHFRHSGRINFDIDENSPEELAAFFCKVKAAKMNYVEAAARSVSGFATGAMWLNVLVEVPESFDKKLLKLVGASPGESYFEAVCKLHDAYARAFAWHLAKQEGIKAGAAKDLKRARYLTSDPEIYVNEQADTFTLKLLAFTLKQLAEEEKKDERQLQDYEREAWSAEGSDVFEKAESFARSKYSYETRQLYVNRLAIALNCFGVPYDQAEGYINAQYPDFNTKQRDALSYPYKKYKDSFGRWLYLVRDSDATADEQLLLQPGQYLSAYADKLAAFILTAGRVDLKAGTGTGKNYAVVHYVASALKVKNGCRSVLVTSLNAKAEKDAEQYGLEYVTGERLKGNSLVKKAILERALTADLILVNQDSFARLADKLTRPGEKLNIFIDESQTLVNGMAYRREVLSALMKAVEAKGQTVTLMSGTPKPYFQRLGFKRIEVVQADRSDIVVTTLTRLKSLEMTVLQHCQMTDFDQVRLCVKIQSKAAIRRTKALLVGSGFKPEEVVCLFSEKSVKESQEYKQFKLAKKGEESFHDQVKVVLCTSFINEGLDIYSSREIQFVNIEKKKTFNVDDLVQFADRWRTDGKKTLFSYHPEEDDGKKPDWTFNALATFDDLLETWQEQAGKLTEKLDCDKFTRAAKISLKNSFTTNSSFLYQHTTDDGKESFQVNFLAIAHDVEQARESNTTTAAGWCEIAKKYPYFKITEQQGQAEQQGQTEELCQMLEELKQKDKLVKLDIQDQLATLYDHDREVLFQAVGMLTDDHDLKSKISFSEDRKEAVSSLLASWPAVFQADHLDQAERLVKGHFKLVKLLLPEHDIKKLLFDQVEDGRQKLASGQKLLAFTDEYTTLLLLLLYRWSVEFRDNFKQSLKVLEIRQAYDGKALLSVIKSVEELADQNERRLSTLQLFRAVNQAPGRRARYSQKQAVRLACLLFDCRRVTSQTGAAYEIGERRTFDLMLSAYELDRVEIFAKLMQVIDLQDFAATIHARYNLIKTKVACCVAVTAESEEVRMKKLDEGQTVVLNVTTDKKLLAYASERGLFVYCGRDKKGNTGTFGNSFKMKDKSEEERAKVISEHKAWLASEAGAATRSKIHTLKGKALGCFCYPLPCHCDHLADLANSQGGLIFQP